MGQTQFGLNAFPKLKDFEMYKNTATPTVKGILKNLDSGHKKSATQTQTKLNDYIKGAHKGKQQLFHKGKQSLVVAGPNFTTHDMRFGSISPELFGNQKQSQIAVIAPNQSLANQRNQSDICIN